MFLQTSRTLRSLPRTPFLIGSYGLLALTVMSLLGDWFTPLDSLSHFRRHFLMAALVIGSGAFAFNMRAGMAASLLALALNGAGLAWTPPPAAVASAPSSGVPLKIMSFNIWGANRQPEAIAALIRTVDADVVVLQEAARWLAPPIVAGLRDRYPHQVDCIQIRLCRLALLSKYPLTDERIHVRGGGKPAIIDARLVMEGRTITVVGTHITTPHPLAFQRSHMRHLAKRIRSIDGPVVAAGDFNATPWSANLRLFARLSGLKIVPGLRPSWPALRGLQQLPIDHVFLSDGLAARRVGVGPRAGSDHRPIIAEVVWGADER